MDFDVTKICKDCKYVVKEGWLCKHPVALEAFLNVVTGDPPTCKDMRSDNGRGCSPNGAWYKKKGKR